ncbi:MAG: hypothetical protein H7A06_04040 [Pseudomonadales bacterium]|nr:hypothetical protein [Pseudomonadales bacterium]
MDAQFPQIRIDPPHPDVTDDFMVSQYINELSCYHLGAIFHIDTGDMVFSSNNPMGNELADEVVRTARKKGIPVDYALLSVPGGVERPRIDVL